MCLTLAAAVPDGIGAATEESMLRQAEAARQTFMADKSARQLRHNWLKVINRYNLVINTHPKSPGAETAGLTIGDLYLDLYRISRRDSDIEAAVMGYRDVIKRFPYGDAAAKAQLRLGQIYYQYFDDPDKAFVELLKVELNHPKSRSDIREARKLMVEISGQSLADETDDVLTEPILKTVGNEQAIVQGLRHWHNPTYSRVAVDLTQPVQFKDHLLRPDPSLNKPMRLYLDFTNARIGTGVKEELAIGDGLLEQARVAQFDKQTVRLVLDIQNITNYRIFSLDDPFRIVVDVTGDKGKSELKVAKTDKTVAVQPEKAPGPATPPKSEPLTDLRNTAKKRKKIPRGPARTNLGGASLAKQLGLSVKKVVIDPGHGGKDHGATGITGLREKDLTLKVAKSLAQKIENNLGLDVVMTRTTDVFLPLEERTATANTEGADLFISIHANAHLSGKVHGLETYFLNVATDEEAMRVAALENATTKRNMSDLQIILADLMLNSKITESGRLADRVHRAIVAEVKKNNKNVRDLGVKQAPFYVLIGANMPSILVELGFLSNAVEEKRLKSKEYLDKLTDGLVQGIKAYNDSIKKNT
jgi:N-acetylmuramoyl-L-alanine amidase